MKCLRSRTEVSREMGPEILYNYGKLQYLHFLSGVGDPCAGLYGEFTLVLEGLCSISPDSPDCLCFVPEDITAMPKLNCPPSSLLKLMCLVSIRKPNGDRLGQLIQKELRKRERSTTANRDPHLELNISGKQLGKDGLAIVCGMYLLWISE
jgi:hypothetical protein